MITLSTVFTATLLLALLAVLLWFIVRKKYRRVWFPLVSIFQVPTSRLPRLRWRWPPWLAFLCFLVTALAICLFALRPHYMTPMPQAKRQLQLYLFLDFSPSLTARVTIEQYRVFLNDTYERLQRLGNITVGTSHTPELRNFSHLRDFTAFVRGITFHRAGLRMASVLRQQLAQLKSMDRIIMVADNDQHTWHNFYWQHLTIPVHHLVVPQLRKGVNTNLYVQRVSLTSTASRAVQQLDVEVGRAQAVASTRSFTVAVYQAERQLTQVRGQFNAKQLRVIIPLRLPRTAKIQKQHKLRLRLEVDGEDAIHVDNDFYFMLNTFIPQVTIIADLHGERLLDDPLFQLHTVLEVLGFRVARRDRAPYDVESKHLWIVAFGRNFTMRQHCPKLTGGQVVWLMPQSAEFPANHICRCYQRLRGLPLRGCVSLVDMLKADGAVRSKRLPIYYKDNFTVFTTPPYAQRGLSYAAIPVFIQQLLQRQGLTTTAATVRWPRVVDIFAQPPTELTPSNVPRGESLLQEVGAAVLPPAVEFGVDDRQVDLLHYRANAEPWLYVLLMLVGLAMVVEIVGVIVMRKKAVAS